MLLMSTLPHCQGFGPRADAAGSQRGAGRTSNPKARPPQEAGTQLGALGFTCTASPLAKERDGAQRKLIRLVLFFIPSSIDHISMSMFALDCEIKLQRLPEQINGQTHPDNTRHLHAQLIPKRHPRPHLGISHNQGKFPERFTQGLHQFNENFP